VVTNAQRPGRTLKSLPGQAGGIVTLIFELVTLSYRAPACPAKLTRPRALRWTVVRHYKEMKLNKIILTFFFLLTAYFMQGESNKISHTVTFEYIEGCETGKGECYPVNINRKTINDSILIYFPNGGTISDVYLYYDSIFNNWINKTVDNPEFLRHDKKMLIKDC
jgi:hypothetical protein